MALGEILYFMKSRMMQAACGAQGLMQMSIDNSKGISEDHS
jgi:hypothetical protein